MTRICTPRRWNSLVLTAVAISMVSPVMAQTLPEATIWMVAEGGEGGEAGAVADLAGEVAFLAELALVEGHLWAARDLYAKGQVDDAIGLSYHPEAEMMDQVRQDLIAHHAADITPAMTAFSQSLESGAPLADVDAALAAVSATISAARQIGTPREHFDAVVALLKAAAHEYAGSIQGGKVDDVLAYHESYAFTAIARARLGELAPSATPAAKALTTLEDAAQAYGDMATMDLVAADASILAAVAARVELLASQVR